MREDIKSILNDYVSIGSITNTKSENEVNGFFEKFFSEIPYFLNNPGHCGSTAIENDRFNRHINWGFVKGSGNDTIVFIHHSDVVTIDNYNELKEYALDSDLLYEKIKENLNLFNEDARNDYISGKWMFGRGTADMKGGGAIQLSLLKHYSTIKNFKGNILVVAVPDEENLSLGMRNGVKVLRNLKEQYGFNYKLMINSEPHERLKSLNGLISQGSIGKTNIFIYIRGVLTHCGKIYEGFNPLGLMGRIASEIEMNIEFSDTIDGEMCPPPSFIYMKDRKMEYDISTPEGVCGYVNILSYSTSPYEFLEKIKKISKEAMDEQFEIMKSSFKVFAKNTGRSNSDLEIDGKVMVFDEFYKESIAENENFDKEKYKKYIEALIKKYEEEKLDLIEINNRVIEYLLKEFNITYPLVIIGLAPPLYPGVSNINSPMDMNYEKVINEYTKNMWNQEYDSESYFNGISDLSFSSLNYDLKEAEKAKEQMPLWGNFYSIPFEDIKEIDMPSINIGPWGKDLHKIGERVFKEDLFERTYKIIDYLVTKILNN